MYIYIYIYIYIIHYIYSTQRSISPAMGRCVMYMLLCVYIYQDKHIYMGI